MLPLSPSLLVLVLLQGPTAVESPPAAADRGDVQRVELSLVFTATFEVSFSPGLMMGWRFDAPVTVRQEIEREHAKNQRLREENQQLRGALQQLRSQLNQSVGLMGLYVSGVLSPFGILLRQFPGQKESTAGGLSMSSGTSYRANESVAVEVWVLNSSAEPWTAVGASLVTAKGENMEGIKLYQSEAIPPNETRRVFIEVPAAPGEPRGPVTLNLWEAGPRSISIPSVMFP